MNLSDNRPSFHVLGMMGETMREALQALEETLKSKKLGSFKRNNLAELIGRLEWAAQEAEQAWAAFLKEMAKRGAS